MVGRGLRSVPRAGTDLQWGGSKLVYMEPQGGQSIPGSRNASAKVLEGELCSHGQHARPSWGPLHQHGGSDSGAGNPDKPDLSFEKDLRGS